MVALPQQLADKQAQIAQLRTKLAAFDQSQQPLPTPAVLRPVLPQGTLFYGATITTNSCPTFISYLLEHFSAQQLFSAVVGWPEFSYASLAADKHMEQVVAIPDPGPNPLDTIGMLEGFDCIIWYAPIRLTSTQARPLLAKMRNYKTLLIAVGAHIPARPHVEATITAVRGLGNGQGRIEQLELTVSGNHNTVSLEI